MKEKTGGIWPAFALMLLTGLVHASDITITISDKKQRPVHGTIIELVGDSDKAAVEQHEITQEDKEFVPELSVIPMGSQTLFSNKDSFQHHVYSVSEGNEFDLPLYKEEPEELIQFNTAGVVKIGCNIHDWMLAFAYVNESPYLQFVDPTGSAQFTSIPAGEYELRVWNPRMKNNKHQFKQTLSVARDQHIEQTIEVSLRTKIRKPRRLKNKGDYSSGGAQSEN